MDEREIMASWNKEYNYNPVVTIMCIVFNHEEYIAQCIEGFVMQITSFPFVIVIHDDASTDSSAEIIRRYAKRYPHIIKPVMEKENIYSKGTLFFENEIQQYTKTKYIATCEGDDYWSDPTKLQKQFDYLESNPECIAVGHLTKSIDKNGEIVNTFVDSKPGFYTKGDNEKWQLFSHYSSYFYRNILLEMDEKEKEKFFALSVPGDRKYPILFMKYGKLYVLDDEMSVYRFMSCPTSFTSNNESKGYFEFVELEKYAKSIGIDVNYEMIKKNQLYSAFVQFIRKGDKGLFNILRERNNMLLDLFDCILHCIIMFPSLLIRKIKNCKK